MSVAPNVLARQFAVAAPDRAWVTDITYLRTQEGWLYLAVILDLFAHVKLGTLAVELGLGDVGRSASRRGSSRRVASIGG